MAALEPTLGIPRQVAVTPATRDPEAHALFLRGLAARGRDTPEGMRQAERHLDRAIERDSTYAGAWAALASIRTVDGYRRVLPDGAAYDSARAFAQRALDLDPTVVGAHVVLGCTLADHDWDFATAERHFRRALELEPGNVVAMRGFARFLAHLGRRDEALDLSLRALELDPVAPVALRWLGTAYMLTGEHDRAVELLGRLDAAAHPAAYYRAMVLAALGDHDGAFRELDRSTDLRESLLVQVGVIPSFDVLHRDPRFEDVLPRVGLRR